MGQHPITSWKKGTTTPNKILPGRPCTNRYTPPTPPLMFEFTTLQFGEFFRFRPDSGANGKNHFGKNSPSTVVNLSRQIELLHFQKYTRILLQPVDTLPYLSY